MTEIRRITGPELPLAHRIGTIVYNGRFDYSAEEKPDPLAFPAEWRWAAFENGRMVSSLIEIPYLMSFDGHKVKMSGIGGVGTLPEARKGGKVRNIFEKLLPEAYETGVVFSNLTPFSHAFYRKFGYELSCARNEVSIPIRAFSSLPFRGQFTQIFPGDDTAALDALHKAYIADLNHGIYRDYWPENLGWRIFTRSDPYTTGTFLYLWQDESGVPQGYIKYQQQNKNDEPIISVQELAFTGRDGLYGVLGLMGGLGAQFRTFQWLMPVFLDPVDLVSDPWSITQRIIPRDMTRVVNAKTALELMRKPAGEGEFVIDITDPLVKANEGRYLVEYGAEGSRVSLSARDAHIRCDIPALSQLITGYRTPENALRTKQPGLEIYGGGEILNRVFTLRPQHVTEYF
ncbi:MAG: GNAT family N-acetyltransferase [Spirochaetaceae bacterium]|jgi:predicted acetyltransferase|nr:GNAT family N-acetyltransferase [Spirochaetaceae bacterium]